MATVGDIQTFVYDTLQTDDSDLPLSVIVVFVNETVGRYLDRKNNWPHLYQEGTLAVVAGTRQYVLASASFSPQTFTTIESVWDDSDMGFSLGEIDFQQAERYWIGTNQPTEKPRFFSQYNARLNLYPEPVDTVSFRIGGYKEPTPVTVAADTPDIPTPFHGAVMYDVVSLAQAQAEDYEGAAYWRGLASFAYEQALKNHFTKTVHRPIILHGRDFRPSLSYAHWIRRSVP